MKLFIYILPFIFFFFNSEQGVCQTKVNVYLIPGQGADYRLYKNLNLDTSKYTIHYINWIIPEKKETLSAYARRIAEQIDTVKPYVLIGVSLGGMVATEITEIYNPVKTIIISSAKSKYELPIGYRMQKVLPLYAIIPKRVMKYSAFVVQPLFEPDRKLEKETCKAMLQAKDPVFVKRTVKMIMKWQRERYDDRIVHIHGEKDNTIPIRNVKFTYLVQGGSHMMILTKTSEIHGIIEKELKDVKFY